MTRARDNYQVTGQTVGELIQSLNFLLQRLADRMDRIEGIRGTASIESDLDMNSNVIAEVGGGEFEDDAARLSDITAVSAYTVTAGDGLTGGGAIGTNPTLNVGAGTALTVSADAVGVSTDGITNSLLANMSQGLIKGRAAGAGTGDPSDLTATEVKAILALASTDISDFTEAAQDSVLNAGVDSTTIDFTYNDGANNWTVQVIDDSISDAKLRNSGALSVIGRSANSTGDPADISSSSNDTVLRRTSSTLNWGQLTAGMFPNTVVPDAALSSNVALKNSNNNFSILQKIGGSGTGVAETLRQVATASGNATFLTWYQQDDSTRRAYFGFPSSGNTLLQLANEAASSNIQITPGSGGGVQLDGKNGFQGTAPISKPTVTGSRGGNAALASVLTALANYGLITDSSSA